MWAHEYQAAIEKTHKTNNSSEGWHHRLNIMIGKHHPDFYTALEEIRKEQGDTEACIAELSLGRRVKTMPKAKWLQMQDRIEGIVSRYQEYADDRKELDYLRTLAHTIVL